MSLFLCVDCGGSKTSTVITNAAGDIVGRAHGGPSNFAYIGLQAFLLAVGATVSDALKTCVSPPSVDPVTLPPTSPLFAAAWFGVSGVNSQGAIDAINPPLSALLGIPVGPNLMVTNDVNLVAAPLRLYDDVDCAVACIAGTGSYVTSFKEGEGMELKEMGRAGGWGWILGDEGGGFSVGREAIRQILLDADIASVEGPPPPPKEGKSTLVKYICDLYSAPDVYELLTVVHLPDPAPGAHVIDSKVPNYAQTIREKRLSQLAPLVFRSAFEDKDPVAMKVLRTSSSVLVDQICILLRPGALRGVSASNGVLCFGGSLVGIEVYRQLILEQLKERGHVFKHIAVVEDVAAIGAKGLALATAGRV
ncbi:hypothetical protein EIP91_001271 [Steccherinum ochraceum]|uniref:N-acetyl-D-glucosamine kinase n=1 Tax=Steccherinum ochraceum TaxID=92696 RepID=A0A4R0RED3_9APHY|nr:hypothetical protein EIP91_001271 [Steccherinum ochraceum]